MYSKCNVLLAEDSEDDALLLKRAFHRNGVNMAFQVVKDGAEAIAYLAGQEQFGDRNIFPLPHLLLLDLKMPGTGGFEVLKWMQCHGTLGALPTIVLTSSNHQADINMAHALGTNAYTIKPVDPEGYQALIEGVQKFWLGLHQYPSVCQAQRPSQVYVLLRQGEEYMQPSGDWSISRKTARVFPSSTFAYYWAKEKELLSAEVLLAFDDPRSDIVMLRTSSSPQSL